ncbi:MAG TPA: radical SAM protein [Candidatus Omnitrophota bacterium]|nr:radical SAM protein [Candidatus Omnitrophota bacterium]HPT39204.1 radical SAM protein [Candidatus Omnitrophota bacterium]
MVLINSTRSLCPKCLKIIPAQVVERDGQTYICKTCQEHGYFEAVHPLGDPRHYRELERLFRNHSPVAYPDGLVINLISSCNLNCPFCFARANEYEANQPSLDQIKEKISGFAGSTVYLSGGEPTLRDDLFEIIREIKKLGYKVALFTNGQKLQEGDFIYQLKKCGLDLVILQFDTFSEEQCEVLRGKKLVGIKLNVIERLKQARIPVYLFSMLAKGVNTGEVGKLIEFTVKNSKFIKILNLNPVWEMGRVGKHDAMNMSGIFKEVEEKTCLSAEDFIDGSAFSYYVFSILRQVTGRGGNKHPWCEMRAYVFPEKEKILTLGQAMDIKKLNRYLKQINERLEKKPKFKMFELIITAPYGFLIKEFLFNRKFKKLAFRFSRCLFSSVFLHGKFSLMDFQVASLIIGTFHTVLNVDLNLVGTCNLYSDFPGGQYRSSCLRQISLMSDWEAKRGEK